MPCSNGGSSLRSETAHPQRWIGSHASRLGSLAALVKKASDNDADCVSRGQARDAACGRSVSDHFRWRKWVTWVPMTNKAP